MTISVPTSVYLVDTDVVDYTDTFYNTVRQNYPKGSKVQYGDNIYYAPQDINIPEYDAGATYVLGDLSFKDGYVMKYISSVLGEIPKQPDAYTFDTSLDHTTWTQRYAKLGGVWSGYPDTPYTVEQVIGSDTIKHTIAKNTSNKWEHTVEATVANTGVVLNTGNINASSATASTWANLANISNEDGVYTSTYLSKSTTSGLLLAKFNLSAIPDDAIIKGVELIVKRRSYDKNDITRDNSISIYSGASTKVGDDKSTGDLWGTLLSSVSYGGSTDLWGLALTPAYLKSADFGIGIKTQNTSAFYGQYMLVDVIKLKVYYEPVATTTVISKVESSIIESLQISTVEEKAIVPTSSIYQNYAHSFRNITVRPDGVYGRTNKDAPVEYTTATTEFFAQIEAPTDVGFYFLEKLMKFRPFDEKNYTTAIKDTSMTYTVRGLGRFDTLALGRVIADSIDVTFKDSIGNTITQLTKTIDSSRDADGNLENWYTTAIYYSSQSLEPDSTVEFTLHGDSISLGNVILAQSVDAGFTNLTLKSSYKDLSVLDEDEFGNIAYVERAKISKYEGSVDVPISDYDRVDRLMTSLGAKLIVMNGSDAKNEAPNGRNIFASTRKIGRIRGYSQQNKLKGNDIDRMATYTFNLEEIV